MSFICEESDAHTIDMAFSSAAVHMARQVWGVHCFLSFTSQYFHFTCSNGNILGPALFLVAAVLVILSCKAVTPEDCFFGGSVLWF